MSVDDGAARRASLSEASTGGTYQMARETVWILGAGFSRALGGPLLRDLLTTESVHNIRATFPAHEGFLAGDRRTVLTLYSQHRYRDEAAPGQRLWRDAEEFIDYLDTAALKGGPARTRLEQLVPADDRVDRIKALAWAARSMVAAECSAFLVGADPSTERWDPYRRWFQDLTLGDTLITFNYDLVLEKLEAANPGKIHVVRPGVPSPKDRIPVLKLHGSVDWKRISGLPIKCEAGQPDSFPLTAGPDDLAVATPGPTKAARSRELDELWTAAAAAIRSATAVAFVGYRFPPSDASARMRILQALSSNSNIYLAVHSVLGPRLRDDDLVRMNNLLAYAMRQANRAAAPFGQLVEDGRYGRMSTVVEHPLWAEDFLGYVGGSHLTQANLHFHDSRHGA